MDRSLKKGLSMFKAKASKEVKVDSREYWFVCDHDSPLQEVIDVLAILSKDVKILLDNATKKAEASKEEFEPVVTEV